MGKSLIIKGANFSVNGIAPTFRRLSWIGGTTKNGLDQDTPQGQFINSGIRTSLNMKVVVEFTLVNETHSAYLFGGTTSGSADVAVWAQSNGNTQIVFFKVDEASTSNYKYISKNLWDGNRHKIEISKEGVVLDGTTYNFTTTSDYSGTTTAPFYLDSCAISPSGGYNTKLYDSGNGTALPNASKIHNVKIYTDYQDDTTLVVDAIPVKRLADNVVCFYNTVNGEYLERNNGSTPEYGTL